VAGAPTRGRCGRQGSRILVKLGKQTRLHFRIMPCYGRLA
jgi:hypothetical protein